MGFFNIIGLLALLGVPAVIILHMLKQKQKDVKIPSTFLWERAVDTSVQSKPWQKLKKSLPLILQLIAAAALGLAAARPYVTAFGTSYNYVVVMDSSASMSADELGESRLELAKDRAEKLIGSASASSNITVISACEVPYTVYSGNDKNAAQSAIRGIEQTYGGIDTDALESLAAAEAAKIEGGIYIFTDNADDFKTLKDSANMRYTGQSTENAAITLASANGGNVLVSMANYGTQDVRKTVTVYVNDMAVAVSDVILQGNEQKTIVLENVYDAETADNAEITVTLTPEDILSADDTYYTAVNKSENARVLLVTDGNTFLENAVGLVDGTELYKMSPTVMETADLTGYDLYIFDGTLPDEMPTDGGIFVLNPPDGNSFIETDGTKTINGYATGNTELSADGALSFALSQTKNIVRPSWAVTELSADGTPVIIKGENNGQRICVFSFDLHDSELPLMKDFPVMIYNLADYFLPSRSGTTGIYCGQKLNTAYSAAAEKITVTNTEGEERTVAPPFPSADYSDTQQPGFYTVSVYSTDGTVREYPTAVNVKTDTESRLSALEGQDTSGSTGTAVKGGGSLLNALVVLAILALIAEWWVKYHGIKR